MFSSANPFLGVLPHVSLSTVVDTHPTSPEPRSDSTVGFAQHSCSLGMILAQNDPPPQKNMDS